MIGKLQCGCLEKMKVLNFFTKTPLPDEFVKEMDSIAVC